MNEEIKTAFKQAFESHFFSYQLKRVPHPIIYDDRWHNFTAYRNGEKVTFMYHMDTAKQVCTIKRRRYNVVHSFKYQTIHDQEQGTLL
ncbi:hypothetical protein [Thiomicrorhabdus indica]|uniref:hypothetical protein n=1 Tax=Thiomicrorhabdus indica TaxID=2267253 RepID=UPI00102DC745|nr:hypothetical protein [Thiomicrorhabdus indica]